jgi:uncharacterized protein (TIGR03382 family)
VRTAGGVTAAVIALGTVTWLLRRRHR